MTDTARNMGFTCNKTMQSICQFPNGRRLAHPDKVNRIDLNRVVELQGQGAQLIEVLSRRQFEEQHLPGAISLPLAKFKSSELAKVDKNRPLIVYCWDYQ